MWTMESCCAGRFGRSWSRPSTRFWKLPPLRKPSSFSKITCRTCGGAAVWAARVGYVGELGWELHLPVEVARHVYKTLWQAGEAFGIADVGYRAIESLRLEKGYVYWSADVTPDYTPLEAGLAFCVDFNKGDFIGRDALAAQKAEGVKQKLCTFSLEGFAPLHGDDAIMKDGKVIGRTTSAWFMFYRKYYGCFVFT